MKTLTYSSVRLIFFCLLLTKLRVALLKSYWFYQYPSVFLCVANKVRSSKDYANMANAIFFLFVLEVLPRAPWAAPECYRCRC